MVTRQLQAERMTAKARQPKTTEPRNQPNVIRVESVSAPAGHVPKYKLHDIDFNIRHTCSHQVVKLYYLDDKDICLQLVNSICRWYNDLSARMHTAAAVGTTLCTV